MDLFRLLFVSFASHSRSISTIFDLDLRSAKGKKSAQLYEIFYSHTSALSEAGEAHRPIAPRKSEGQPKGVLPNICMKDLSLLEELSKTLLSFGTAFWPGFGTSLALCFL